MAFNFIKKVFSFGKDKEDAPAPDATVETEPPATDTGDIAPGQAFPAEGEMQFTPQTAPGETLATPEPADADHAGEPPVPTDAKAPDGAKDDARDEVVEDQAADTATEEWVAPEELAADPAASPTPEQPEMPATATEQAPAAVAEKAFPADGDMQFTPETTASDRSPPLHQQTQPMPVNHRLHLSTAPPRTRKAPRLRMMKAPRRTI